MRKLLLLLSVLLFAGSSLAATVTINIPPAAIPFSDEICELVRVQHHKPANTTKQQCAQLIFNEGLIKYYKTLKQKELKIAVRVQLTADLNAIGSALPTPLPDAFCGDGVLDSVYGEFCDDGNQVDLDGCSSACEVE